MIIIPVTNPLERLNGEIKRRTEVVGIFPNEAAMTASTMLPNWTLNGRLRLIVNACGPVTERDSAAYR